MHGASAHRLRVEESLTCRLGRAACLSRTPCDQVSRGGVTDVLHIHDALITELGPVLSISHVAVHLIVTVACEEGSHHLHFTEEGAEA